MTVAGQCFRSTSLCSDGYSLINCRKKHDEADPSLGSHERGDSPAAPAVHFFTTLRHNQPFLYVAQELNSLPQYMI